MASMKAGTNGVIVDTNVLIYSLKNKVDLESLLFSRFRISRIMVPDCVIKELEGLSNSVIFAKGALRLAERFTKIESEDRGDPCILKTARKTGLPVLTNDRDFLLILKREGITCMTLRNNREIVLWS